MGLSMGAIFAPLEEFFVSKFSAAPAAGVRFRFDAIGSVITDADFIDENHADLGYLPALAVEKFSDLVNRVPVETGDGVNVVLSQSSIDDTYFYRLLGPAVPYLAPGAGADAAQAALAAFSQMKATALRLWEANDRESLGGLMLSYKPSLATPERWFDGGSTDAWTRQSFQLSQPAGKPAPNASSGSGLRVAAVEAASWRLAPDPELLAQLIPVPIEPDPVPVDPDPGHPDPVGPDLVRGVQVRPDLLRVSREAAVLPVAREVTVLPVAREATVLPVARARFDIAAEPGPEVSGAVAAEAVTDVATLRRLDLVQRPELRLAGVRRVDRSWVQLAVKDRLRLGELVVPHQPTQPAGTDRVEVSFEYCLVGISRPWLMDVFLTSDNWYLPGVTAGALAQGAAGLPALPIAMVAIRNLVITADWSTADLAASEGATSFGPFRVDGGIVDGAVRHSSIQVIGWVLQQLPGLPPRGDAAAALPPTG